jgi:TPR repeat protein
MARGRRPGQDPPVKNVRVDIMLRHVAIIGLLGLGGCVGAVAEGANIAKDKATISANYDAARAGNAEAQYKVGEALCCSVNESEGFYDTPRSVAWLCRAAAQNYGPAAYKLGEIYAGEVVSGARVIRRISQTVVGSSTNKTIAYAWLSRASSLGVADAGKAASALWPKLSAVQQSDAQAMATGRKPLPCEWETVVGRS